MGSLSFIIIVLRNFLYYIVAAFFMLIIVAPLGNIIAIFSSVPSVTSWLYFGGTGLRRIFRFLVGVKVEYRGLENLIKGPCIIASKHQSAYETFMVFNKFYHRAVYVIKAEFGKAFFYLALMYKKYDGIKIKREDGIKALIKMERQALKILKEGRQVIIFPEGTRVKFGETSKFKRGIERIYSKANVPVIPVALNTGAVMPKDSFFGYRGKIIIEFLPPIMPGLCINEFTQQLKTQIDTKTSLLEKESICNYYLKKKNLCNK